MPSFHPISDAPISALSSDPFGLTPGGDGTWWRSPPRRTAKTTNQGAPIAEPLFVSAPAPAAPSDDDEDALALLL